MQILHELPTPANHSIRPIFLRDQLNNMPSRSNLSFAAPAYNTESTFKTAVELASAQGLSLTQRLQNLLESVDIPNLTIHTPGRSPNPVSAYEKMLALQTFKSTPQYQLFKARVTHTLTELDRISNSAGTGNQRNTNFQDLGNGLWQPISENESSRFGLFQADLYQQACPDASRLLRMHSFAHQRPDLVAGNGEENTRATIRDLSQRLDVCAPGIVQHFDEAVNTVRQAVFTPSLPERFEAMRIQIARNAIAEFVRENPDPSDHGAGNEIHKVAAWQNHFAASMNLPVIEDVFASRSYAADHLKQTRLKCKLTNLQPKPAISRLIATRILEEAHDVWNQLQCDGVTDLAQGCMTIIEKISIKHGAIEPHCLFDTDEDGMPCTLHHNPTLLALSLLRQVRDKVPMFPNSPKITRWTLRHDDGQGTRTIKSQLHLSWLEISQSPGSSAEPEIQLLSTKHLSAEQTAHLLDLLTTFQLHDAPFKSAVHELLRNDWGQHLKPIKSQEFDPTLPNDVFIHLAMGFAHGLKLGKMEAHPKLPEVFSTALAHLNLSKTLKCYSPDQIVKLLNHAHQLQGPDGQADPFHVCNRVNALVNLRPSDVECSLYKAALEFNWNRQPQQSLDSAIGNPAFAVSNPQYGLAYVDVMAKCAPHCLTHTLCENIDTMVRPEVALRFFEVGAIFTATSGEQPSALQLLMRHRGDAFVTIVLNDLSQRGLSLQEVARPEVIAMLKRRGMSMSAATLRRYPSL